MIIAGLYSIKNVEMDTLVQSVKVHVTSVLTFLYVSYCYYQAGWLLVASMGVTLN